MILSASLQEKFKLLDSEKISDYVERISVLKDSMDCSWKEFALLAEAASGVKRGEDAYRKAYKKQTIAARAVVPEQTSGESDYEDYLNDLLAEIKREKVKLSDERTQNNALVRRLAREETIPEIATKCAEIVAQKHPLSFDDQPAPCFYSNDKEAILLISDWHYGLDFTNAINTFNPDVCEGRVVNLTAQVLQRCQENGVNRLTVLNLADLIAGRIHTQIRIQSREDVMSQILHVCELLTGMLTSFASRMKVEYYDCLDNHSRIEPNKSESLDLESLARFIPFYLRARLVGSNVEIHDNSFSEDIITCKVLGYNVVGVHGDKDKPVTALDKITLLTRKSYDLMCTAHLHHFSADEKCGCITIGNGSLMGADDYALNLRLFSTPSQTLIIATRDNVCDTIYKLNLD